MPYRNKNKQREFNRNWIKQRRQVFFNGKICVKCGSESNLHLDHIDRKIKVSHRIWSWREERRNVEIAKCQILCTTCHKFKTQSEFIKKHGIAAYNTKRCRCVICKGIMAEKTRRRRLKLKLGNGVNGNTTAFGAVDSTFDP